MMILYKDSDLIESWRTRVFAALKAVPKVFVFTDLKGVIHWQPGSTDGGKYTAFWLFLE